MELSRYILMCMEGFGHRATPVESWSERRRTTDTYHRHQDPRGYRPLHDGCILVEEICSELDQEGARQSTLCRRRCGSKIEALNTLIEAVFDAETMETALHSEQRVLYTLADIDELYALQVFTYGSG